jgi:ubiquinone/menaquinone biosynthesis C-methylase UbiE
MLPRPNYLRAEYASRFKDQSVVDRYHLRLTYPLELFTILSELITDEPRAVLDVGSGSGDIARRLVSLVERVDAVDFSQPMLEKGRLLPDGNNPKLRWIYGRAEDAVLYPPYALITAGQSLHWMEWDVVLPRFQRMLTANGYLAIVNAENLPLPWSDDLLRLIKRLSANRDYQPFDLIKELEVRGLFQLQGEKRTALVPFMQSLDDYIESFHAMSSLSRDAMGKEAATEFDAELRSLVSRFSSKEEVEMQIIGTVVWGRPQSGVQ